MVLELRLALNIANTYVYKPESIYIYTYMPDSMSMPIHEWNLW